MNHWSYVITAYGLVLAATLSLAVVSFREMRSAERAVEELKQQ